MQLITTDTYINDKNCITFRPRIANDPEVVEFIYGDGCTTKVNISNIIIYCKKKNLFILIANRLCYWCKTCSKSSRSWMF